MRKTQGSTVVLVADEFLCRLLNMLLSTKAEYIYQLTDGSVGVGLRFKLDDTGTPRTTVVVISNLLPLLWLRRRSRLLLLLLLLLLLGRSHIASAVLL
jgi:hypothetical protein